jgi:hypothetical protein
MRIIGELSAALVEQMLRVAESCLVDEEQQLTQSTAQELGIQKAIFIHSLCLVLSNVTYLFSSSCQFFLLLSFFSYLTFSLSVLESSQECL